ncbi:MAG: 4-phosphopantetheinyl transferase, partial [Solirubrobacteraceae bacterium]|nr:4-phosphopantetheinyl transferase [Solirubrobacteraceae bacterium]
MIAADAKECAVWWAEAGCAGPGLAALLPAAERERAGRLRREVDRDRTIVAWALVRTLLGELLGERPCDVAIERHCVRCGSGDHGKPLLADTAAGLHFSLAHSGPHVVVALSRAGAVGVDVECFKPTTDYPPLVRRTLTADEAVAFDAGGARPRDFLRTWVRK